MTDKDYTHLCLIVDRSGSMYSIASDMDGAILALLEDQEALPGRLVVDMVTFDTEVEMAYVSAEVKDIKAPIIRPRGGTALNDAVGKTVVRLGEKFAKMSEDERPGTVVMVVVTDGGENASRWFTKEQVKELVTRQTEVYKWTFIYLAANVDAFATGGDYGFAKGSTIAYAASSLGTKMSMGSASRGIRDAREGNTVEFSDEERIAAEQS
jgi:uncharacterized protein YegL